MPPSRTIICTFTALASGLFGAYVGNQLSVNVQTQSCEAQPWGIDVLCKASTTPAAAWNGGFTGFWTGTIIGAFVGGLATHKGLQDRNTLTVISDHPKPAAAKSLAVGGTETPALELTSLQTEVLYCLLVLLATQSNSSGVSGPQALTPEETAHYLPQFRRWAEAMAQSQPNNYDVTRLPEVQSLTAQEARQLLMAAGFSAHAIDQAWQIMQAANQTPPL